MRFKACVFDAYGTLFDVAAAARDYAEALPPGDALRTVWPALAETWRLKQLEYCWLRSIDGRYRTFWTLTGDALDHALEAHGVDAARHRAGLLALYRTLRPYPEVRAALEAIRSHGAPLAILSNGDAEMLSDAVAAAGFSDLFSAVLSVEEVRVFKPHPSVYALAASRFDCAPSEILFFSANGWDVCSAAAYGFTTIWVNRRGAPLDRLGAAPTAMIDTLAQAPARAAAL